ncbi:MAG: hypothetical protein JXB13_08225 [Phycisphaerae bacterium]|nr:hypothetical protein [Phycisphaerae bacterium]
MNYECTARSNYFRVKDEAAFRQWAESRGLDVLANDNNVLVAGGPPERLFAIHPVDEHGWPTFGYDEQADQEYEFDLFVELARHLHVEDVAVLMEVGHEGLRYVAAYAVAVNAQGETEQASLEEIYERADKLAARVTRAEY